MPAAPLRVFISYARADSTDFVDRLERDLKAQQFVPWVDRHGLEGGDEWMKIIQQAIDNCHALVVVLSPAAVQSKFVRIEYRYASEIGKLVIPLRYLPTPTTPMDLRVLQWADFQSGYEAGLRQLVQALSRIKAPAAPQPPAAQPQPQPTPAPATPLKTKEQWLGEGNAHYNANRYGEALAAFDQAIALDPQFARAYNGRGNTLWYLNRYEEALAAFDQAITLDPQYARAHYGRGNALDDLKRYAEALAAYDRAIALDPQFAYSYYNKAYSLDALGRREEAEHYRKKARELGYKG